MAYLNNNWITVNATGSSASNFTISKVYVDYTGTDGSSLAYQQVPYSHRMEDEKEWLARRVEEVCWRP